MRESDRRKKSARGSKTSVDIMKPLSVQHKSIVSGEPTDEMNLNFSLTKFHGK